MILNLHLHSPNQNIPLYLLIFYQRFWPLRIFSLTCCEGTFALGEIDPPANLLGITFLETWSDIDCHHLVCVCSLFWGPVWSFARIIFCVCVCASVCVCVCVCVCVSVCVCVCAYVCEF